MHWDCFPSDPLGVTRINWFDCHFRLDHQDIMLSNYDKRGSVYTCVMSKSEFQGNKDILWETNLLCSRFVRTQRFLLSSGKIPCLSQLKALKNRKLAHVPTFDWTQQRKEIVFWIASRCPEQKRAQINTRTCPTQSPWKLKCWGKISKHDQATVYHQSKYFPRHPPHLSPPMSAACGSCVEKMCRLKSPLEPQWHCILYHREVWWNCRAEGPCNLSWWYKQFEISQHPKNCAGQKTSLCMWKDFTHGHYSWYEATEMLYRSAL